MMSNIELIANAAFAVTQGDGYTGGYDRACDLCRAAAADADRNGIFYTADMLADMVLDVYA